MNVGGVELAAGAVALLAARLDHAGHMDLSMRLGHAVDMDRREIRLTTIDRDLIRPLLKRNCPESLLALRDALQRDTARL